MKILHVIPELLIKFGGPPFTLAALARAQADRGDEVVVLSSRRATSPTTLPLGQSGNLTVREVQTDSSGKWPDQAVLAELRQLVRDRDIVHVHGSWRYHFWASARVCREADVPYIVRPAGNLGIITRRHKWYIKQPIFWLLERRLYNRAAAIHCTSVSELDELKGLGLRARKFVVPNAVPLGNTQGSPNDDALHGWCPQIHPQDKLIVNVGRISWKKKLDVLLEAFVRICRQFPDWRLVLAGPHEEPKIVDQLQRYAAMHGIADRVFLPGAISGDAKSALFCRASIFAQSSVHENFGISVAEAMLFGIPCALSTGVAIASDVVRAGAGFASKSSPEEFAKLLEKLMADESIRVKCSRNAKIVAERYMPERVADELDREYRKCLARN